MNKNDAREYMIWMIEELMNNYRGKYTALNYIRGQAVGMVKAFKEMGVIPRDDKEILDELLEMI